MARAAMYYFESAAYCYICHKHTDQTRIFSSDVQDLDDPKVEISMHAACYRKEMARICLVAVFSFIMAATILSFAGSYLLFRSLFPLVEAARMADRRGHHRRHYPGRIFRLEKLFQILE